MKSEKLRKLLVELNSANDSFTQDNEITSLNSKLIKTIFGGTTNSGCNNSGCSGGTTNSGCYNGSCQGGKNTGCTNPGCTQL